MVYSVCVLIMAGEIMILYIARHGESLGNTGENNSVDPELSEKGKTQASLLGKRMEKEKIDCIISSPLIRAVETAVATAELKNMPIEIWPLLFEVGTESSFKGQGIDNLKKIYNNLLCYDDGIEYPMCLGNENKEISYQRAKDVIERIRKRFDDNATVMIVAHGTFNNYLINAAFGFPVRDDFNFCQENTGLNCIKFIKDGIDKVKAEFTNDYSHLCI